MSQFLHWTAFLLYLLVLPALVLGLIRRTKARLQNRVGPPYFQALFDLIKLCQKGETVSDTICWLFRSTAAINLAIMLVLAAMLPWTSFKPQFPGADLFFVIYTFAIVKFFTVLAALDSGSSFGAFASSRELFLSVLVEPPIILALAALGISAHTSDLFLIFSLANQSMATQPALWTLVGTAILISSMVELSRMPIDDPTTHLELTMVHEAMIIEASGRNLALTEYAHALRMVILFGLACQCFLHAIPGIYGTQALSTEITIAAAGVIGILGLAIAVGIFEGLAVKLQWRKTPDFIAYSLTMSLLACLIAVGGGIVK